MFLAHSSESLSYGMHIGETIDKHGPGFPSVVTVLTALLVGSRCGLVLEIPDPTKYDLRNDGAALSLALAQ